MFFSRIRKKKAKPATTNINEKGWVSYNSIELVLKTQKGSSKHLYERIEKKRGALGEIYAGFFGRVRLSEEILKENIEEIVYQICLEATHDNKYNPHKRVIINGMFSAKITDEIADQLKLRKHHRKYNCCIAALENDFLNFADRDKYFEVKYYGKAKQVSGVKK